MRVLLKKLTITFVIFFTVFTDILQASGIVADKLYYVCAYVLMLCNESIYNEETFEDHILKWWLLPHRNVSPPHDTGTEKW